MTLKNKHKIIKKIKDHKKKLSKEQKIKDKKKVPRKLMAPSVPSGWPFREQEMADFENKKLAEQAEEDAKKAAKKARHAENKRKAAKGISFDDLEGAARRREQEFEFKEKLKESESHLAGKADPDGSRRAFYKEFARVVDAADVVIHVLDARDPLGCRCPDVERYIIRKNPNKKIILLLNKVDLIPRENVESWLKYLREELPTVAFKCSTQKGSVSTRSASAETAGGYSGADCLGAENLLQLLKNYSRNNGLKTAITVGIVGFPNVGKSSLINSLMRARAVSVGATPGLTREAQEVHLDKQVKLLDSPGIVFPTVDANNTAVDAALRNAVRVEKLEDPITPVNEIVKRCTAKQLTEIYQIPRYATPQEFLQNVAIARGKIKKGGTVDIVSAARMVLQDWNTGKIPYFTNPPERAGKEHASAAIVSAWGREFNAEEVFANESSAVIAGLPTMEDGMYIETQSAGQVQVDLDQMESTAGEEDMEESEGEDAEDVKAAGRAAKKGGSKVNLYAEEGMFDPRSAKKQKKEKKKQQTEGEYSFETDFEPLAGQMMTKEEKEEEEEEEEEDDSVEMDD